MAKLRSPNYPNYDLDGALRLAEKVYAKDGRNKVSRAALATHLGHESLSGPALGKIGALRAYGLLDGSGEELRMSEDAISALKAPQGSEARKAALERLAVKPALFQAIKQEYPTPPSKENLTYWLIKQGFADTAAAIAATSYLNTMYLVENLGGSHGAGGSDADEPANDGHSADATPAGPKKRHLAKVTDGERELVTGMLSKDANFRVIVSGPIGVKEIERLIKKLEFDKDILADQADSDEEAAR